MEHVLRVSIDKSTSPWSVDIDQHDNANHIGRQAQTQTIAWELTGDATAGTLLPMEWIMPPPQGIFGPPEVRSNGKRMTLSDLNNGPDTSGSWDYRLSLDLDGQHYSTVASLPVGTNTNPSIKNN